MAEIFKPVQGFPDYEIGDCGTVISLKRGRRRVLRDGRKDRYGHRKVSLCRKGEKPKSKPVHQLVAAAFIGPRPEGFDVDHINSDPRDNRAVNLRYVTRQQNNSTPHARAAQSKAKDKVKRPVVATKPNGSIVRFKSVNEAAKILQLQAKQVFNVLSGRCRTHHGYTFKYAEQI